jgi:hypothetical protein
MAGKGLPEEARHTVVTAWRQRSTIMRSPAVGARHMGKARRRTGERKAPRTTAGAAATDRRREHCRQLRICEVVIKALRHADARSQWPWPATRTADVRHRSSTDFHIRPRLHAVLTKPSHDHLAHRGGWRADIAFRPRAAVTMRRQAWGSWGSWSSYDLYTSTGIFV